MASATLRALLAKSIDYAGLFPPSSLSMTTVARNFAAYRLSSHAWALGRLVVPASRLDDLSEVMRAEGMGSSGPVEVSALVGSDVAADVERIRKYTSAPDEGTLRIETAEVRVERTSDVEAVADQVERSIPLYVEFPLEHDPEPFIVAISAAGARAKIRTGGVTPDAFPSATQVARFIVCCAQHDLCFKATAGLHHPVRGSYRLTYEPDAPSATMYGFVNVFVAAALARAAAPLAIIEEALGEADGTRFEFADESVIWRDRSVTRPEMIEVRRSFVASFGSCSFLEPIEDLHKLELL